MPQAPQHTNGQCAAPCAEAALQGWRQVVAPTVFLAKKRQKAQKEVRYKHHCHNPRCRCAPVGQIFSPAITALHRHRKKDHSGLDRKEIDADDKSRQQLAVQAQAAGLALCLFLGQQEDPAQHRRDNDDKVCNIQPALLRQERRQNAHGEHQRSGRDVQDVKPLWRPLPSCQQKRQHNARRRVEHLGVGKNRGVPPVLQADVQKRHHQKRNCVSTERKDSQFFFIRFHRRPPLGFPTQRGAFCKPSC